jgi:NTE family protein
VQGTERSNPDVLKRALGIVPGESIDDTELAARIRRLGAGGDFERINFRLQGTGIDRVLVVQPTEVEWGGNTLRFGMRLQSDFKNTNEFDLLAAHTLTWVNSYAAEWRNILQVGSTRRFETELYQPASRSHDWFASTGFSYRATDTDLFENGRRTTRIGTSQKKVGLYFGRQLGLIGEFRVGRTLNRASAEALIPAAIGEPSTVRFFATEAQLRFDTHDSAYFPRSGYQLIALAQRAELPLGATPATFTRGFGGSWAVSSGPYTLFSVAQYTKNDRGGAEPIGGFLRLSGTATNSIGGDKTAFGRVIGFKRIGQLPGALGGSVYAGLSLEAGRGYSGDESFSFGGLKRAAALVVGMETIVGPFYFGVGKTANGGSAVYLNLGQPQ